MPSNFPLAFKYYRLKISHIPENSHIRVNKTEDTLSSKIYHICRNYIFDGFSDFYNILQMISEEEWTRSFLRVQDLKLLSSSKFDPIYRDDICRTWHRSLCYPRSHVHVTVQGHWKGIFFIPCTHDFKFL